MPNSSNTRNNALFTTCNCIGADRTYSPAKFNYRNSRWGHVTESRFTKPSGSWGAGILGIICSGSRLRIPGLAQNWNHAFCWKCPQRPQYYAALADHVSENPIETIRICCSYVLHRRCRELLPADAEHAGHLQWYILPRWSSRSVRNILVRNESTPPSSVVRRDT